MDNKGIEKHIAYVALIISLLTMVATIRSCSISGQALEIAKDAQKAQLNLVLEADFKGVQMNYSSNDPTFDVQNACMRLPSFNLTEPSFFPHHVFNLSDVKEAILKRNLNDLMTKNSGFIGSLHFPVKVATSYIVGGDYYVDLSEYIITYEVRGGMSENGEKSGSVDFYKLIFNKRIYHKESNSSVDNDTLCEILG